MTLQLPYRDIARLLIERQKHTELAERYLSLRKRLKSLRNGDAHSDYPDNPLARAGLRMPLSVADQPSDIVVRAEGLKMKGIPVAFEKKDGRHQGFTIDEARHTVFLTQGYQFDALGILSLYEEMMTQQMSVSEEIRSIKSQLRELEKQLMDALVEIDFEQAGRKLSAFPPASILAAAVSVAILNAVQKGRDWRSLIIAFNGNTLRVNGIRVSVGCGRGGGSGVIRTENIQVVLSNCEPNDTIELDFRDSGWIATTHRPSGISTVYREFQYYQE